MLSLLHPGAAQRAARKRVPKARVVVEQALRDREALSRIRMALSLMSEAHNMAKTSLDHVVRAAEKVYFGQDYLDSRLKAYHGQKRAVFLYHDYFQGRPAFERFERLLDSPLFDLFPIAGGYQPYSQDLRISAEYERRVIDQVLAATDIEEISLVGHSQGGIVARYLLQELAAPKVKRCVFLATPHRGTYSGYIGYPHRLATLALSALPAFPNVSGESALQLLPGSSFLDRLNSLDLPAGVEYTSIYNYLDPLLIPARYGRMPYPQAHNILMMKIGHYHSLYDQQETEIVLRALVLGQSAFADFRNTILGGQELLDATEFGAKATADVFVTAAD